MFGKNPIRKPEKGDGTRLYIQEIFPTLQGEGPNAGDESIFIRLGGCNLACAFCDTEFEEFEEYSLDEIIHEVDWLTENNYLPEGINTEQAEEKGVSLPLVVITGGEPLRQNIIMLCEILIQAGYRVQIETNGTLWRDLPATVEVMCSPKASDGRYHPLRPDIIPHLSGLKFLVSATRPPYVGIPDTPEGVPVWLQPMDEYDEVRNLENLEHTLMLAMKDGHKVSLQTHKFFNLD